MSPDPDAIKAAIELEKFKSLPLAKKRSRTGRQMLLIDTINLEQEGRRGEIAAILKRGLDEGRKSRTLMNFWINYIGPVLEEGHCLKEDLKVHLELLDVNVYSKGQDIRKLNDLPDLNTVMSKISKSDSI